MMVLYLEVVEVNHTFMIAPRLTNIVFPPTTSLHFTLVLFHSIKPAFFFKILVAANSLMNWKRDLFPLKEIFCVFIINLKVSRCAKIRVVLSFISELQLPIRSHSNNQSGDNVFIFTVNLFLEFGHEFLIHLKCRPLLIPF